MNKPLNDILIPKPIARLRIYAYSIDDSVHKGLLKIGQTTKVVRERVAQQLGTAGIINYQIELDEPADREDGTLFSDHEVRFALKARKFEKVTLGRGKEWMRCTIDDVKTVITELRTGQKFTGTHSGNFRMRDEQLLAVTKTYAYYHSRWRSLRTGVHLASAPMVRSPPPRPRD
ncbi:MAG: GIY-YIG nuclease family protein [Proteobacteria bacterium]|nr:MAG: GIY-YIG nuclease family protein [Pseudomonadota bacterium]